jgi:hypothetical protein
LVLITTLDVWYYYSFRFVFFGIYTFNAIPLTLTTSTQARDQMDNVTSSGNTTEIVDIIKAMGWTINNVDVITSGATVIILLILLVVKLFSRCCGSTTPKCGCCGCCASARAGTTWQVISEMLTPASTTTASTTTAKKTALYEVTPTDVIITSDDDRSTNQEVKTDYGTV